MIDLEIPVDCARAAASDSVKDTVDYKSIAKRTIAFVSEAQFHLVETLAHKLAMTLLAEFDIAWIRLSLNKPGAIRGSRDVGVTIERRPRVTLAYVSGGSNLDAERNILLAARALKARHPGARFSRCYRNKAVGFDGPDFINFVVELPVAGTPALLKGELECIETQCGRVRDAPRWAPRAMDLDILLFGDVVQDTPVWFCRGPICCAGASCSVHWRNSRLRSVTLAARRLASCGKASTRTQTPCTGSRLILARTDKLAVAV